MFGLNDNQADDSTKPEDKAAADNFQGEPAPINDAATHAPADDKPDEPNDGDLIDIKEQALRSLSPLVGHLEQAPEERFRTLMMLIQASDDSSQIKTAYEAANQIQDEKARAQALLDIVNEINYFTQKEPKT